MIQKWLRHLQKPDRTTTNELEKLRHTLDDQFKESTAEIATRLDKIDAELQALSQSVDGLRARSGTRSREMALQIALYVLPPQVLILVLADLSRRGVPLVPRNIEEWLAVIPILASVVMGISVYVLMRSDFHENSELFISSRKLFLATSGPPLVLTLLAMYGGLYLNVYVSIATLAMILFFAPTAIIRILEIRSAAKSEYSEYTLAHMDLKMSWAHHGFVTTGLTYAWLLTLEQYRQ